MSGIKFKMLDGSFEHYDPIEENDFEETEDLYILNMAYTYEIPKRDVEYFEWYETCEECGYELPDYCLCIHGE